MISTPCVDSIHIVGSRVTDHVPSRSFVTSDTQAVHTLTAGGQCAR